MSRARAVLAVTAAAVAVTVASCGVASRPVAAGEPAAVPTAGPTTGASTATPDATASPAPGDADLTSRLAALAAGPRTISGVYTTGYTFFDNTPPGSPIISHPVRHRLAGGTGTYADPITAAVGHSKLGGRDILDYPPGTRFYLPHLRRYFIVEDTCGDGPRPQLGACHSLRSAPRGARVWIDLYVGGSRRESLSAVQSCAGKVTDGDTELHRMVVNPGPRYLVAKGPLFSRGRCTAIYPASLRTIG